MRKIPAWLYILATILLVVVFGYGLHRSGSIKNRAAVKEKPLLSVDAFVVKPEKLVEEISVAGSLRAFEEVELKNEVAGRVVRINLPEGQYVKEGTLLVKLFDDDLQANLKKLQTQLAIQEKIYERKAGLLKVNGISRNDYDQTGLQLNSLRAEIEIQKALIRKTEVLAPFDGVIGLRNISVGAEITPSTLLATIRTADRLKLDFSVPEKYSPAIRPGMKVKFSVYDQDRYYDATVIATEQGISANTRNLRVRASVDGKREELIPGAFTNVTLRLNEKDSAMLIPTQAIIPHERGKSVILVRNGKARFTDVKTGVRKASSIEIVRGIEPGDTVITTGIMFLKDGDPIVYSSVKTSGL